MIFMIVFDQQTDGHWLAEVMGMSGVAAYGDSQKEAMEKVEALARRVVALHPLNPLIPYRGREHFVKRDWQEWYDLD